MREGRQGTRDLAIKDDSGTSAAIEVDGVIEPLVYKNGPHLRECRAEVCCLDAVHYNHHDVALSTHYQVR